MPFAKLRDTMLDDATKKSAKKRKSMIKEARTT